MPLKTSQSISLCCLIEYNVSSKKDLTMETLLILIQVGIKFSSSSIFLFESIFLILAIGISSSSGVALPKIPSFSLKLASVKLIFS